jgi:glycosyltransferase involved in cell wall biosynthesis
MSNFDNGNGVNSRRPALFMMINTLERGGTERQFVTMARALAESNFEVAVGCLACRGEFMENLPGIQEFPPRGKLFLPHSLYQRLLLASHLRRRGTVIAHSFDFYANLMLIPAARLAGVPVVIGSHRQLGDLLTPLQFCAQNIVLRMCDRIVCNSRAATERLQKTGLDKQKVTVIPNALPQSAFAEAIRALPSVPGVVRIGMIARMNDRSKNHLIFLRAAARLAAKFQCVEFVLVGDGPLRPELETLVQELKLGSRVRFLGDRHDIPEVLASLNITVLPSSSESSSNAIVESMAAGVPVVASDVGGNAELIQGGETGLLVQPEEHAFTVALQRLVLDSELRRRCGQKAKAYAKTHHNLETIRHRYEELYQSLLIEKCWEPGSQSIRSVI